MTSDLAAENNEERLALERAGWALMSRLLEAFPRFETTWASYLAYWGNEPPGPYINIAEFAHFVEREFLAGGQTEEVRRAFLLLDQLFLEGNEATRDLIGIGLIEDLQNILGGRADGCRIVIPLLPPTLLMVWNHIEKQWAGHGSLMDVIEAEVAQSKNQLSARSTWAQLLQLPEGSS